MYIIIFILSFITTCWWNASPKFIVIKPKHPLITKLDSSIALASRLKSAISDFGDEVNIKKQIEVNISEDIYKDEFINNILQLSKIDIIYHGDIYYVLSELLGDNKNNPNIQINENKISIWFFDDENKRNIKNKCIKLGFAVYE